MVGLQNDVVTRLSFLTAASSRISCAASATAIRRPSEQDYRFGSMRSGTIV